MVIPAKSLSSRCTTCGATATKLFSPYEKLKALAKGRVLIRRDHGVCQSCRGQKRRAAMKDQGDAIDLQEEKEREKLNKDK